MGARVPYAEGSWFAVPLRDGGYATGLVARATRAGKVILCYFFGPRRREVPALQEICNLTRADAVAILRVGDLELIRGGWPILGAVETWDRSAWPMPEFLRTELLTEPLRSWRVRYDDADPNRVIEETPAPAGTMLQPDRLCGAGAAEIALGRMLP